MAGRAGPKANASVEIEVVSMQRDEATLCILGRSPLIFNRVAAKAQRELLLPRLGKLTDAQKAQRLKHNPVEEYRDSVYRRRENETGPTRLQMPSPAFKGALMTAALDTPSGVTKSRIGRLTWVEGYRTDIYGIPQLLMSVVRSADIGRTPDIRTRAIIAEWAAYVRISYIGPVVTTKVVSTLAATSGLIVGVGDWRQEKGSGNHGQYEIVDRDNADFQRIIRTGGMKQQDAALAKPACFDADSEDLLAWFQEELKRREREPKEPKKMGRKKGNGAEDETRGAVAAAAKSPPRKVAGALTVARLISKSGRRSSARR